MIIHYRTCYYSNPGGTRTHIVDAYNDVDELNGNRYVRIELRRATDMLKVLRQSLTGRQISILKSGMKYREDFIINEAGKSPYTN